MKIRKAVITAAGWGTRFLPITRSQPKEMLPLVDKPLIQYSVEEAVNSGIKQVIVVTSENKKPIEDYFGRSFKLETFLKRKKETKLLKRMREISSMADICYVQQKEPLGLGHAILTAKDVIGDESFAVVLPDDILISKIPALKQIISIYDKYKSGVIAVESIRKEDTHSYGIVEPKRVENKIYRVLGLVEKPEPSQAPSRLAIIGRYILTPAIFDILKDTPPGKNGEIQLTDALCLQLKHENLFAYELEGTRYDAGMPLGWLKANVELALDRDDIGQELKDYLKKLL
jgi:UTP--glucose-1-phosphate uridylyltransferase